MAKMYSKIDLTFSNGYVIDDDHNVVCLPDKVAEQLNELEEIFQKAEYLKAQDPASPMPSLDGFERESIRQTVVIEASTPTLDAKVEEGMKIRDELRKMSNADTMNETIFKYQEVFHFVQDDTFVEGDKAVFIDTPKLGNPLNIKVHDLLDKLVEYVNLDM